MWFLVFQSEAAGPSCVHFGLVCRKAVFIHQTHFLISDFASLIFIFASAVCYAHCCPPILSLSFCFLFSALGTGIQFRVFLCVPLQFNDSLG